jgi:predicted CXXCH cytochrome family protein
MTDMRKRGLIIAVVAVAAMALMAGLGTTTQSASADAGPHIATGADATPDKCAGCHRIHTGQNEYLLKEAGSVEDFCYSCHGTGGPGSDLAAQEGTFYGGTTPGAPYGGKTASTTVGLRAGGFDAARINSTDPSTRANPNPDGSRTVGVLPATEPVVSQHAIDGTTSGTMWGNGAIGSGAGPTATLDCGSCHNPHGNGQYRILRPVPTGSGGAGYGIPDTYPKTAADYTVGDYFSMNFGPLPPGYPAGTTPPPGDSILVDSSAWCAQCHTRYLATRNGATPAESSRENSGDPIFTFRHTSSGISVSSTTGEVRAVTRACITCHASHGSNAQMPGALSSTVPWPDGSTVNPPNDTQRASLLKMNNRGICLKCHNE